MDNTKKSRKKLRLSEYDYAQSGAYFVTVLVRNRKHLVGKISREEIILSKEGQIAQSVWDELPGHFPNIDLDEFIVMPNHILGIIWIKERIDTIDNVRSQHAATLQKKPRRPAPGSLGAIVRSYKSAATKQINLLRSSPGAAFWHRSFYDHVIRDDVDLFQHRKYIQENPLKWELDAYYRQEKTS